VEPEEIARRRAAFRRSFEEAWRCMSRIGWRCRRRIAVVTGS
jgi:hypothetical protein